MGRKNHYEMTETTTSQNKFVHLIRQQDLFSVTCIFSH
jgi:hypothetical protein